jgi:hypothetical protein
MSIEDFIIAIFCLVEDEFQKMLKGKKLRQGGRIPNTIRTWDDQWDCPTHRGIVNECCLISCIFFEKMEEVSE